MTARALFLDVWVASIRLRTSRESLALIEERARALASPQLFAGKSGHRGDQMLGRVAPLIERGRQLRADIESEQRTIDRACLLLFGPTGREGLHSLLPLAARALWWRYCYGEAYRCVGVRLGIGTREAMDAAHAGLDLIDSLGVRGVALGIGTATG